MTPWKKLLNLNVQRGAGKLLSFKAAVKYIKRFFLLYVNESSMVHAL